MLSKGLDEWAVQKRLSGLGAQIAEPDQRGPKALAAPSWPWIADTRFEIFLSVKISRMRSNRVRRVGSSSDLSAVISISVSSMGRRLFERYSLFGQI